MPEPLTHFYANGALLVMWGALVFHYILPIPYQAHPVRLWRSFALILSDKVNSNHSYQQSIVSGGMAWLLMIFPTWLLLWALKPLVWQPQLFDLALLLIALGWRNNEILGKKLIRYLSQENKAKARQALEPFLNRETAPLSQLGLGKAGAETLLIGFSRNVIGVLFWYGLLGAQGALLYRLNAELARVWSPSRKDYQPFGLPVVRVQAMLDYLPLRLFALFIAIGGNTARTLSMMREQGKSWPTPGPGWLIAAVGNKFALSLGGPAIYNTIKSVRPKIGGRIAPAAFHLAQIQHLMAWRACVWLLLQSLIMAAVYQGF
ncbi:cobalamin biosynthesis family protein [Vibrio sp. SCSIO 43136]|uniref:cobalamin biosynthesis family protein n=1 Tax=Vibrio sp. SCSIO 43136 TaxID=2819101 RepID=UPI002075ABBF|nr:cobalamin biosynthesis family protein [Vibrio sp. SCSIO 43136]USD65712.1 cobalamin biosynthesis family protein [Vibrio sp. SCSIO 43136]